MSAFRLLLTLFVFSISVVNANEQYNQGSEFAKGIKGQEQSAISGFDPAAVLPNYTSTPPESGYYGGATNVNTDFTSKGNTALNKSEVGKAITESILNTPSDNKPSMDAPFIKVGSDAQDGAESVTDGSFDGCIEKDVSSTEYSNHVCSRDTKVDQYCTRNASITGQWKERWVETSASITVPVAPKDFNSSEECFVNCQSDNRREYRRKTWFYIKPPLNETFTSVKISVKGTIYSDEGWQFSVNKHKKYLNLKSNMSLATLFENIPLKKTDAIYALDNGGIGWAKKERKETFENFKTGKASVTITYNYKKMEKERYFEPYIAWSESCPFNKAEGALTNSECIAPGGNRTVYVEGKSYTMYSNCWAYKDTYLTQSESEGSCSEYIKNPACTVANRQCAYELDGFCLHENLTYSCEHKTTGSGVMCGGTFFCKDGSCALAISGKNNSFQRAVSELAALAGAAQDVAEMNGNNVRAFTGKAHFCKKFAVGFNNCCKDSGWGQDIGLASCSSEEKALGEARKRQLVVDVGEFCSKKVLGACIEKKRSYCVFESKLAQIVQQQGRLWQLGVGFGGASSPNCNGITIEQLQSIKFDALDFSNFYADLENGSSIPEDNALLERVQQQIQAANKGGKL